MYDVRGITLVKTDQAPDYTEVDMSSIDDTNERTIRQDDEQVIRLPSYETVAEDPEVYAQASCFIWKAIQGMRAHWCSNTEAAIFWVTPPPIPLTTRKWTGRLALCPVTTPCLRGMRRSRFGI